MINSRILYFCLGLTRYTRVNIISICGDYVHGTCPCSLMDFISTLSINEGYGIEFQPMIYQDSKVSFTVTFS